MDMDIICDAFGQDHKKGLNSELQGYGHHL